MFLQRGAPGGPRVWSPVPLGGAGLVVAVVLLSSSCVVGQGGQGEMSAQGFPDPLQNPYGCNNPRGEPSLICDPSKYLTEFQQDELQVILKSIRERGTCPCTDEYSCDTSYTVAIAIVPAIATSGGLAEARSALLEFATTLQSSVWQHGTCGENVVVAYSVGDNIIETSAGRQARTKLEDECRDEIQKRVNEYLRNGQTFEGLTLMAREYREYLNGEKICNLSAVSSPLEGIYVALIFMCIIIFFGLAYCFIVSFRKCSQPKMAQNKHPIGHPHGPKVHIAPTAPSTMHVSPVKHQGYVGPAVVPGHHTGGVSVVNRSEPVMVEGAMDSGGTQGTTFSLPYGRADGLGGAVNVDGMDLGGNSVSNITIGGNYSGGLVM